MSTPMTMTNCPSDETLAAVIDGRLDPASRRTVIEHMSSCSDCYAIVSAGWDLQAAEVVAAEPAPVVRGRFGWGRVWVPAAVAAGLILAVLLPGIREWIALRRTGVSGIVAAQDQVPQRLAESRSSVSFPYKPLRRITRGVEKDGPINERQMLPLLLAGLRAEQQADDGSWKKLRAAAIAQLAMGHPRDAAASMERAVARKGKADAALLTDLAAIYVEIARNGQPGDAVRAVSAAERAWQAAHTPENAWNRALAYKYAKRRADAIRAWNDYLKLDSSSPWATEAAGKIKDLQEDTAL